MARELVVILGAGASYDCALSNAVRDSTFRPPLVTQLFEDRPSFVRILHEYPLAEQAAADIRPAIASGSIAIEAFLRERLRDADNKYALQRYRQVPLYLQHLLHAVSQTDGNGYTMHPDNYDALINAALALDDVLFITLNYDTLLDERLFAYDQLRDLDSYIDASNWSLIKLHGSVNWGRPSKEPTQFRGQLPLPLINAQFNGRGADEFTDEIVLRNASDLGQRRLDPHTGRIHYPALAVPLGSEDELVLPPQHEDYVHAKLAGMTQPALLVLGYSGLDRSALRLVWERSGPFGRMMVVNGNWEAGAAAATNINRGSFLEDSIFPAGFAQFVADGKLSEFIDGI